MGRAVLTLLTLAIVSLASAQSSRSFGIAYCDLDKLYDTIPSHFYDDRVYTPQGQLKWDSQRYGRKIEDTARVIDSMALDIVALYGVESEQVVRDLAAACKNDYSYIHRTSDSYDGLDFALLYFGDVFFPDSVKQWNRALCVEGSIGRRRLTIIINHLSQSLGVLVDQIRAKDEDRDIIILGRFGKLNFNEWGLSDMCAQAEAAGRGNAVGNGGWYMRDRIATNIAQPSVCDVYAKRWMLTQDGKPQPTYFRRAYRGGRGSYLPVFIFFDETFGY